MLRKRRPTAAIVFTALATLAGLALLQMRRHRLQAADDMGGVSQSSAPACSSPEPPIEQPRAASGAQAAITVRLDYAGAEGIVDALERDSLSSTDVDSLLRIPGLCAMVDNVTRFFPGVGAPEFRRDIRRFARTKKRGDYDAYFRFSGVWQARSRIRALISAIRTNETALVAETIAQLHRYRPDTGALVISAHFVAGGVSTGFVFETDPTSLYADLLTGDDEMNGIASNLAHEVYHVMQVRAQERAGINPRWLSTSTMPSIERLFAGTLAEGTANYAVDPTRSTASGPSMERARERYRRNTEPKRVARNFALFDDVLRRLRDGRVTWDQAYKEGFTSDNDDSFYFVGYEMTRALERYCGRACISRLFEQQPVEFFRRYIAASQEHPELAGRFAPETEAFIAAFARKSTK